jgi:hypothetical protein
MLAPPALFLVQRKRHAEVCNDVAHNAEKNSGDHFFQRHDLDVALWN